MITFYFFFDFLVDMVDKGEKCPKYQAFPCQPAVNRNVNQTVNRQRFQNGSSICRASSSVISRKPSPSGGGWLTRSQPFCEPYFLYRFGLL